MITSKLISLEDCYTYASNAFKEADNPDYSSDARILFEYYFGMTQIEYMLSKEKKADEAKKKSFLEAVSKRLLHVPVQYITGEAFFYGYYFNVNSNVLIPRQDTESLIEEALSIINNLRKSGRKEINVLDMCTGSGCIGITLFLETYSKSGIKTPENGLNPNDFKINCTLVDISEEALKVASENALKLDADVEFIQSDMFSNVTKKYDLIVSNPPYIKSDVVETLSPEVKKEPHIALDGDASGLKFYEILANKAPDYLKSGGYVAFETGYDEGQDVKELLTNNGFKDVSVIKDLSGLDRVITAKKCN